MEYIYGSMLLHAAGKKIDEANLKKVLEAADVQVDDGKVKSVVAALDGVDIEQAIKEAAVVSVAATTPTEAKSEVKKEEKKEEKKDEGQAAAGLGALFG